MFALLLSHGGWSFLGVLVVAALIVFAVIAGGGLSLLLNRYVLSALAVCLTIALASVYWESKKETLREEGRVEERAAQAAANRAAEQRRREAISSFVVDASTRETDLRAKLAASEGRLLQQPKERKSHVTPKAEALCSLTLGFVRDYDASLPVTAGRASVPDGAATDDDRVAGIPLAIAAAAIGYNNSICAAAIERLAASEERRFGACTAWDAKFGTRSGCSR